MRNVPPGRGSISAATPCQDSHRPGSQKNEKTVSGAASIHRSTLTNPSSSLPASARASRPTVALLVLDVGRAFGAFGPFSPFSLLDLLGQGRQGVELIGPQRLEVDA